MGEKSRVENLLSQNCNISSVLIIFKCNRGKTNNKFVKLLLNNFRPVISYRRVQKGKESERIIVHGFGDSLRSCQREWLKIEKVSETFRRASSSLPSFESHAQSARKGSSPSLPPPPSFSKSLRSCRFPNHSHKHLGEGASSVWPSKFIEGIKTTRQDTLDSAASPVSNPNTCAP